MPRRKPDLHESPYEVGRWCYQNGEPCPYADRSSFTKWREGFNDAALLDRERDREPVG